MIWRNYRMPEKLTLKQLMGFLEYINRLEGKK